MNRDQSTSPHPAIPFARRVFLAAGIYGLAALAPPYFLEKQLSSLFPPAPNHPEHYYGFLGVALAWQLAFLLIARDVVRYRLFMLPAVAEKLLFVLPVAMLWAQGRVAAPTLGFAAVDLLLAILFVIAYRRLGAERSEPLRAGGAASRGVTGRRAEP